MSKVARAAAVFTALMPNDTDGSRTAAVTAAILGRVSDADAQAKFKIDAAALTAEQQAFFIIDFFRRAGIRLANMAAQRAALAAASATVIPVSDSD